jgi:uncharacterized membrane-anchored protein
MKRLRLLLLLQLIFFGGWGGMLLFSHRDANVIFLETIPIDPRDLLSGHYVALRFAELEVAREEALKAPGCEALRQEAALYVYLQPTGRTIETIEGPVTLSKVTSCARTPDFVADRGNYWMFVSKNEHKTAFDQQINRFYLSEDNPLRNATSGSVVAKIAINKASVPRIISLVPIHHQTH